MSFEMHRMSTQSLFWGSIDARTWRGYRLYGRRMGPIDNFSLVTGPPPFRDLEILGLTVTLMKIL